MFNFLKLYKRLSELEDKVALLEDKYNRINNRITDETGIPLDYIHVPGYVGYFKRLPHTQVIRQILDHLGLEAKVIPSTSEVIKLQRKD